nr:15167_t:CDS:2 [Entrophospora candida]CAG8584187.1 2455_t:CDS:2 [Entrophospora candida]
MKEPFVAIDIIPATPVLTLPSSVATKHRVTGVLRIVLNKPVKVKSVIITFQGKCIVSFSNESAAQTSLTRKNNDGSGTHSLQFFDTPITRSSASIVKQTISLFEDSKKKELKGVVEFPFNFELPADAPPTINESHGYIRYKLTAIITPASLLGKLSQEKVDYVLKVVRPRSMLNGQKRYQGMLEGKIKYDIEVPKMILLSLDTSSLHNGSANDIVVRARLTVMREIARIKTVSLEISQISKYVIKSTTTSKTIEKSFTTYTKPASMIDFTTALPSITQDHHLTLTLPNVLISELSPDIHSPNLEITHNFRITITFMNTNVSPCFITPSVIVGYVDKRLTRSASISEGPHHDVLRTDLYRRGSEGWVFYNHMHNINNGTPSISGPIRSPDAMSRVSSFSSFNSLSNMSALGSVFEENEEYTAIEP